MPFVIFFLVISWPVLEVASIVEVSRWIGPTWTFLALTASIAFGAFLIRSQSLTMGRRVVEAMREGAAPEQALVQSGAIMLAGVLFMIPGFVSDILALMLLVPEARRLIWRGLSFSLRGNAWMKQAQQRPEARPGKPQRAADVIDVEFTEVPPDKDRGGNSAHGDSPWSKG